MKTFIIQFVGRYTHERHTAFYDFTEKVRAKTLEDAKAIIRQKYVVFSFYK